MKDDRLATHRYPAYKDSGIEWLSEVPEHWKVVRARDTVIRIGNGVTPRGGSEVYTNSGIPFLRSQNIYDDGLRIKNVSFISKEIHEDMKSSQLKERDILINITGALIGRTCIFPAGISDANINQHIAFLRIKPVFNSSYISLFLKSHFTKNYIQFEQNGASKEAFNLNQISNIPLVLPPLPEQKTIALYLDTATAKIDRKIDLLTQKATKYGQLKRSIINEAVTRGLDRSVVMKDSAIGEIPEHWEVKRLKELSDIQNSNVDKKSHPDETPIKLCNYVDVYKNEFINASLDFMQATATNSEIKQFKIKEGDLFITKDSETCDDIAIPALATESLEDVICGYHLARLRSKKNVFLGAYLFRLFQSKDYGFRFTIYAKGITRVGLGQSAIADSLTPVPPLAEQKTIAHYLDTKTGQIDQIIQTLNTQIEKLKELRKTLINDVVTGKIKVIEDDS